MSFNDLAKKETAAKKAAQEKDPKKHTATDRTPEAKSDASDPETG